VVLVVILIYSSDILHLLDTSEKREFGMVVYQLLIDFKEAYDSVNGGSSE
jgi:hypothetical protein